MTVNNIIEEVKQIFPEISESQIIKTIDYAQKKYAGEVGILRKSGELTDISSNITWVLPSDCKQVIDITFYDSNDMPLYMDDLGLLYQIVFSKITFLKSDGTKLSNIPDSVSSVYIDYEYYPETISGVDDTLEIDEELHGAILSEVLRSLFSKIPVDVLTRDGVIKSRDWSAVQYHGAEYSKYVTKGKARAEVGKDGIDADITYDKLGNPIIARRQNLGIGSTVNFNTLNTVFTKYIRFTATSPSTVTISEQFGWGETLATPSITNGVISVTGTAVFSNGTFVNPNQNINYSYISSSQIDLYPPSSWGTLVVEIYER